MSEQRIPRANGDFDSYANAYYDAVKAWWTAQGLDESGLKPLQDALVAWNAAYPAHVAAQNAARAAAQTKEEAKHELERQIRPISAFVQAYPTTTNADRAAIGITVRETGGRRTPAPTTRPLLLVDVGDRLTHRLRIMDEGEGRGTPGTGVRGRRPRGTMGAEVYVALVEPLAPPPTDPDLYKFVGTVTGGATELTFDAAKGGRRAAYLVRWVSPTGRPGPWGETVTATVAA